MNKERRKDIASIVEELEALQERIEIVRDEEQDYFDNMPESFQSGEKGMAAEEAISNLDDAFGEMDTIIDYLNSACGD